MGRDRHSVKSIDIYIKQVTAPMLQRLVNLINTVPPRYIPLNPSTCSLPSVLF